MVDQALRTVDPPMFLSMTTTMVMGLLSLMMTTMMRLAEMILMPNSCLQALPATPQSVFLCHDLCCEAG